MFTLSLNSCLSSMVSASALAMTGTMLTIFPSLFINSMSIERNLKKQNKTNQQQKKTNKRNLVSIRLTYIYLFLIAVC